MCAVGSADELKTTIPAFRQIAVARMEGRYPAQMFGESGGERNAPSCSLIDRRVHPLPASMPGTSVTRPAEQLESTTATKSMGIHRVGKAEWCRITPWAVFPYKLRLRFLRSRRYTVGQILRRDKMLTMPNQDLDHA